MGDFTKAPKLTKHQARILRHLRRTPGFFVDRALSVKSREMVDAGWLKATPVKDRASLAEYRATDAGRAALAEFQRVR